MMVTVDIIGVLLYTQLVLSIVLFFAFQLIVILANERFESVGEWIVYRGTWYGIIFQCLSIAILAVLVFFAPTDHVRVTYTIILTIANVAWFTTLRLAFLIADSRYDHEVRSKGQ